MMCLRALKSHKLLAANGPVDVKLVAQLLETCMQSKSLVDGKKIYQLLLKSSTAQPTHPILLEKLTHLYITCGQVELARHLFDEIPDPSVVLCDMMIRGYVSKCHADDALDIYHYMLASGITASRFTFPFVLRACAGLQALEEGEQIHCHAIRLGLDSDVFVSTALLDLYAKCGGLLDAVTVFNSMPYRDVVTWNAMIAGFALHGLLDEVVRLLLSMQAAGETPNSSTIVAVLPIIAKAGALKQGKAMHGYCIRKGFSGNVVTDTSFLDMYAKCGWISYSRGIYDIMGLRNEVTRSAMIGAYVACDLVCEALELFDQLLLENHRNLSCVTLGFILQACAKTADLWRGRKLHGYILKLGFLLDLILGNMILSMYSKCGIIEDSMKFFYEMKLKDTVSYNSIISGCVWSGKAVVALLMFQNMRVLGFIPELRTLLGVLPACSCLASLSNGTRCHSYAVVSGFSTDTSICNALIDMYSKCGMISSARKVFDKMPKHDIISWNAMILGYGVQGLGKEALLHFQDLCALGTIPPDYITFICVLSACSHSGLVSEGKYWFDAMSRHFNIAPVMEHYACMIDLLGRAGQLEEAHDLIRKMPFEPDICVWDTLLAACKIHKNLELGLEILKRIQRLGPPRGAESFVLISNIYGAMDRWGEAAHARIIQKDLGLKNDSGCSLLVEK